MKSQHTPGPWRVALGSRLEIRGPKDEIGWPVPVVYNAGLHTDETAQANARLIAAAPDLLATLEDLLDQLEGIGIADWAGAEGLCFNQVHLAIAKAKGETK
jgi:hypothetical protein